MPTPMTAAERRRAIKNAKHELAAQIRLEGISKLERHKRHHRECQASWRAEIEKLEAGI